MGQGRDSVAATARLVLALEWSFFRGDLKAGRGRAEFHFQLILVSLNGGGVLLLGCSSWV